MRRFSGYCTRGSWFKMFEAAKCTGSSAWWLMSALSQTLREGFHSSRMVLPRGRFFHEPSNYLDG